MCARYIFVFVTKELSSTKFLFLTFLVVVGDVIAEAQPAVASQADMLETIDMAALEACSAITEPPRKVEQVSGGKRKKKNTQEDLLLLKKRKLELEINKLEMSLGYTT